MPIVAPTATLTGLACHQEQMPDARDQAKCESKESQKRSAKPAVEPLARETRQEHLQRDRHHAGRPIEGLADRIAITGWAFQGRSRMYARKGSNTAAAHCVAQYRQCPIHADLAGKLESATV